MDTFGSSPMEWTRSVTIPPFTCQKCGKPTGLVVGRNDAPTGESACCLSGIKMEVRRHDS